MTRSKVSRRALKFDSLEEALIECDRLLRAGYQPSGSWTLAQMCRHLRLTIEANMDGYPAWMTLMGLPLRPFLRAFALPRILAGRSINGVRTAGRFVPPENLDDQDEVRLFEACVRDFQSYDKPLFAHPGFGRMTHEGFDRFHATHAAHHLSFLNPLNKDAS